MFFFLWGGGLDVFTGASTCSSRFVQFFTCCFGLLWDVFSLISLGPDGFLNPLVTRGFMPWDFFFCLRMLDSSLEHCLASDSIGFVLPFAPRRFV